ncbi:MAG: 23S rRNA pseudouridine(1911/1915/1917) synthase RluD [Thiobacillaceae bacterium]|nr:23S rRNA pseudouridine(1911/1915/1917) synthase RluD [Thiobacillaceae bacterium]
MSEPILLTIPPEHAGRRLDQSLASLLPQHSRARIQAWCDAGEVSLNGRAAARDTRVLGGERVQLRPLPHPAEQAHAPEAIALDIVHEDEALIVVNKPPGLVTHPGAGNWAGTLLNALLHHCPQLAQLPRAGIVHRLDKDTSGLMVVAKTAAAQTALIRALQARTVSRVYWALAVGRIEPAAGTIDAPIGRHPVQRTRMAVLAEGKSARTHYRVLRQFAQAAWLECRLETGRTHQIRVHLAHLGHPLLGDPVYGRRVPAALSFHRQALHARSLALQHPVTGVAMHWQAGLPADMQRLLERLEDALAA